MDILNQIISNKKKEVEDFDGFKFTKIEPLRPFSDFSDKSLRKYYQVCRQNKADFTYGRAKDCKAEMKKRKLFG